MVLNTVGTSLTLLGFVLLAAATRRRSSNPTPVSRGALYRSTGRRCPRMVHRSHTSRRVTTSRRAAMSGVWDDPRPHRSRL